MFKSLEGRLIADWRWVATHAYSSLICLLAAVLSGLEAAIGYLTGVVPIGPVWFALLTFLICLAAYLARLWAQRALSDSDKPGAVQRFLSGTGGAIRKGVVIPAAVVALALPTLVGFEGISLLSYKDPVGIWTNCVGETQGAGPGQSFTYAQCLAKLKTRLQGYYAALQQAIPQVASFPAETQVALLSIWYNEGAGTMRSSSVARAGRRGDLKTMCDAFLNFTRAGSDANMLRPRRLKERAMCLEGVMGGPG